MDDLRLYLGPALACEHKTIIPLPAEPSAIVFGCCEDRGDSSFVVSDPEFQRQRIISLHPPTGILSESEHWSLMVALSTPNKPRTTRVIYQTHIGPFSGVLLPKPVEVRIECAK